MKIGDAVKLNRRVQLHPESKIDKESVGIIVGKSTYTKPDGNPNGDFTRHTRFQVLFNNEPAWMSPTSLVVVNENR